MKDLSLLLVAFAIGCEKQTPVEKKYEALQPTDAIVLAETHSFDRQTCDELVALVLEKERRGRRDSERTEKRLRTKKVALEKAFVDEFVSSVCLNSVAVKNGFSSDPVICSGIMSNFVKKATGGASDGRVIRQESSAGVASSGEDGGDVVDRKSLF